MDFFNVVIANGNVLDTDRECLFPDNEIVNIIRPDNPIVRDMLDLLVILEVFPSRSQAKKNWKGSIPFPPGWSEFFIGKRRRHLCVWNPTGGEV